MPSILLRVSRLVGLDDVCAGHEVVEGRTSLRSCEVERDALLVPVDSHEDSALPAPLSPVGDHGVDRIAPDTGATFSTEPEVPRRDRRSRCRCAVVNEAHPDRRGQSQESEARRELLETVRQVLDKSAQ